MRNRFFKRCLFALGDRRKEMAWGNTDPCADRCEGGEIWLSTSFNARKRAETDARFRCGLPKRLRAPVLPNEDTQLCYVQPFTRRRRLLVGASHVYFARA